MQTIKHTQPNIHPIFDEFDQLYKEFSEKKQRKQLVYPVYDSAFRPLIKVFGEHNWEGALITANKHLPPLKTPPNKGNTIIVCVSGGKDSMTVVKHCLDRNFNVYLYHVKGINKTYCDEYKAVIELAEYLDLPYHIDQVKLSGKQEWVEHPLKNMIIANMALQYGIRQNIGTNIAFGNFSSSSLDAESFEVCGGDCIEMWNIYEEIIHKVVHSFNIFIPNNNFQDTIDMIVANPELLSKTISCMTPNRFRNQLRQKNQKKYGFPKMENRCGSCWKCCLEYCVFTDNDILEYDEAYYKHCLDILQATLKKETGIKHSLPETWNHYFFYSKERSKYYGPED